MCIDRGCWAFSATEVVCLLFFTPFSVNHVFLFQVLSNDIRHILDFIQQIETLYSIAHQGLAPITMAEEQTASCSPYGTCSGKKCNKIPVYILVDVFTLFIEIILRFSGGDQDHTLAWMARTGMQPKTDYTTAWYRSAFVLSPPAMPACMVGMAAKAVYKFPDYCKYFAYDEATVVAYLAKFGPGLYVVLFLFYERVFCFELVKLSVPRTFVSTGSAWMQVFGAATLLVSLE